MQRVGHLPFLDERVGIKEALVRVVVLRRPTYSAAWCVIQDKEGRYRVTDRGTGIHDYFWDTLVDIRGESQLADAELRLWNRYAKGPQLRKAAVVIANPQAAAEALAAIPDHRYDQGAGRYVEAAWRHGRGYVVPAVTRHVGPVLEADHGLTATAHCPARRIRAGSGEQLVG